MFACVLEDVEKVFELDMIAMISSKNHLFSSDFYLIKFIEDGIKRVFSSDKVRIPDDEVVEAGSTCEAYWEDPQTKGWFSAIILAFGGKCLP